MLFVGVQRNYEHGNGNFLGQVQLMAKFDPFMKEHLRRIQEKELSDTYLSKHIQNELITHVASRAPLMPLLKK